MKKIKILLIFLAIICFFNVIKPNLIVKADTTLATNSESAYLIEYQTGMVLYSKNDEKRLPIASMTKLMLLLLTFENIESGALKTNEMIYVSKSASGMGGSQVFLEEDKEYLCSDLIKCIIIASANDASVAMAERLFGSEQNCVEAMNEKAKQLQMNNTLYSNCTGLPKPTQYSCAKDVAVLFSKICGYSQYFDYSKTWMDEIVHPSGNVTGLTNTNKLVRFYAGCDGGKTGFTSEAGFCLVATAKRGGMRLISVVVKSDSSKGRFLEVSNMFNYGFDNYTEKCVFEKNQDLEEKAKISNGIQSEVKVTVSEGYYVFGKRNEKIDFKYEIVFNKLKAPINKGDLVGKILVYINGIKSKEIDLTSSEYVREKNYIENVKDIVNNW